MENTPGGADGYAIFGKLALEQHMTINSFYASRYSARHRAFFCAEQLEDLQRHGLQDDTAYVFPRDKASWVAGLGHGTKFCRDVESYILCSTVADRTGTDPVVLRDIVSLKEGNIFSFAQGNAIRRKLLGIGWFPVERWGSWINGPVATVTFAVQQNVDRDLPIELLVRAFVPPAHPGQRIAVIANGTPVVTSELRQPGPTPLQFVVPATSIGADRLVRLEFLCPDAVSPAALSLSADPRELSIGLLHVGIGGVSD